jgi:hypothetical protein
MARLERRARRRGHHRLVDVAAQHLVGAARSDPGQVGMRAVLDPRADPVRIGGAVGEQRRRERARRGALPASGGAVQQVGVRGRRLVAERGAEDGGGVRVGIEGERGH